MVGVKGKYKGCNTCRGRRVKCDNTRPLCRNCVDHGRVCEGYERETVFIVGTVDDKGRCASHPPRNLAGPGPPAASSSSSSSSAAVSASAPASLASPAPPSGGLAVKQMKKKAIRFRDTATSSSTSPGLGTALLSPLRGLPPPPPPTPASTTRPAVPGARDLAPAEPWAPAWSDGLTLGSPQGAGPYRVRFQAIRTRLGAVVATAAAAAAAGEGGHAPPNGIRLALPPSCRASERPRFDSPAVFRLASQCFLRPPLQASEGQASDGVGGYPGPPAVTEEVSCLFLYEQNFSAVYNNNNHPSWAVSTTPCDDILAQGPAFFQTFPAHHFFARLYRPMAILTTLLTRTPSPLANPEWATVPYVRHPPTALDALLDTVALVPGVLADADRLLHHHHHHHGFPPFLDEQKTARDLVARAVALEAELAAWYAGLERAAAANRAMPLLYWTVGSVDLFALAGRTKPARRRPKGGGGGGSAADASATARVPFADTYEFASTVVGLGHVVYWTALMTLYECIDRLVPVVVVVLGGRGRGGDEGNDGPAPDPAVLGMSGDGDGGGNGSAVRDAAAASASVSYGSSGLPPPVCDPARYQVRERRKLAANICRSLDWVIGPSGPVVSSSSSSVDFSSSSAFPSTTGSFSSSPSSSSSSRFPVSPLSSSLSPPSSSPSSSSSSWIPTPPPLPSGSATSVPPFPSPYPNPAMTRSGGGGGSSGPGSVDPELRAQPGAQDPETPDEQMPHRDDGGSGGAGGTGHPDLASIPLWAVERFYDGLGADGALERAWCRGFRARLEGIGRTVDGGVGGGWFEVARFG